jgi:DUF1009 family protein
MYVTVGNDCGVVALNGMYDTDGMIKRGRALNDPRAREILKSDISQRIIAKTMNGLVAYISDIYR